MHNNYRHLQSHRTISLQVLAMADGVNWGEGARTAARCAVRGAIDHLNVQIEDNSLCTTTDVFHELLAAFHSAHSLILQEGGLLTTLCVAVVVPAKHGNRYDYYCRRMITWDRAKRTRFFLSPLLMRLKMRVLTTALAHLANFLSFFVPSPELAGFSLWTLSNYCHLSILIRTNRLTSYR